MPARRTLLSVVSALYFIALVALAFTTGPPVIRQFWMSPLVMFVPVGMLLLLMLGRRRWWVALGFSILGAAWIEAAQSIWMPVGYAELLDLAGATIGASAGVFLGVVMTRSSTRAAASALEPNSETAPSHDPHRIVTQARARDLP